MAYAMPLKDCLLQLCYENVFITMPFNFNCYSHLFGPAPGLLTPPLTSACTYLCSAVFIVKGIKSLDII